MTRLAIRGRVLASQAKNVAKLARLRIIVFELTIRAFIYASVIKILIFGILALGTS